VCDFPLVINSNFGSISYHLATIARNDFQDHPRSMILCHFLLMTNSKLGNISHRF